MNRLCEIQFMQSTSHYDSSGGTYLWDGRILSLKFNGFTETQATIKVQHKATDNNNNLIFTREIEIKPFVEISCELLDAKIVEVSIEVGGQLICSSEATIQHIKTSSEVEGIKEDLYEEKLPLIFFLIGSKQEIIGDKKVRKILLKREQVHRFCNKFVLDSSVLNCKTIQFQELDNVELIFIGIYGKNKSDILEVFKQIPGVTEEYINYLQKQPIGLYAFSCTSLKTVFLIFWPDQRCYIVNGAGDIACSFIAYLHDLCSDLIIAANESEYTAANWEGQAKVSSSRKRTLKYEMKKKETTFRLGNKPIEILPLPVVSNPIGNPAFADNAAFEKLPVIYSRSERQIESIHPGNVKISKSELWDTIQKLYVFDLSKMESKARRDFEKEMENIIQDSHLLKEQQTEFFSNYFFELLTLLEQDYQNQEAPFKLCSNCKKPMSCNTMFEYFCKRQKFVCLECCESLKSSSKQCPLCDAIHEKIFIKSALRGVKVTAVRNIFQEFKNAILSLDYKLLGFSVIKKNEENVYKKEREKAVKLVHELAARNFIESILSFPNENKRNVFEVHNFQITKDKINIDGFMKYPLMRLSLIPAAISTVQSEYIELDTLELPINHEICYVFYRYHGALPVKPIILTQFNKDYFLFLNSKQVPCRCTVDLACFNGTSLLALYIHSLGIVEIKHISEVGEITSEAQINVRSHGIEDINSIAFIPGQKKLLVSFSNYSRFAIFEFAPRVLKSSLFENAKGIGLKTMVSHDGLFLFVFRALQEHDETVSFTPANIAVDVLYISTEKWIATDIILNPEFNEANITTVKHIISGVVSYLGVSDNKNLMLKEIELESERITAMRQTEDIKEEGVWNWMINYFHWIYDRYKTEGQLNLHLLRSTSETVLTEKVTKCLRQFQTEISRKGRQVVLKSSVRLSGSLKDLDVKSKRKLGSWISQLITLIPVQIARVERGGFEILHDGQINVNFNSNSNALEIAEAISLGIYDAIFRQWRGKVKVISVLGKQNTGKSYMLNYLYKTMFDVSGGRCTDGIWLSSREMEGVLYVILDFEGLGSMERNPQEDVLLSTFNAAISTVTFYKTDTVMGQEVIGTFNRMQASSSQLQNKEKIGKSLFCGKIVFVIKDVDETGVNQMLDDYMNKLFDYIEEHKKDSFIVKLFSTVRVVACSPFSQSQFYADLSEISEEAISESSMEQEEKERFYFDGDGSKLEETLKLLMAKFKIRDWDSINQQRIDMVVQRISRHLSSAIKTGSLKDNQDPKLRKRDGAAIVDDVTFPDTGLELLPISSDIPPLSTVNSLWSSFLQKSIAPVHDNFQAFIEEILNKRRTRVNTWIESNLSALGDEKNDSIAQLTLNQTLQLDQLFKSWRLCNSTCLECLLLCVITSGTKHEHTCMSDHKCKSFCSYCDNEEVCGLKAGHHEKHHCNNKDKENHACSELCQMPNCQINCGKMKGHTEQHNCTTDPHPCNAQCTIEDCTAPCKKKYGHDGAHNCMHDKCRFLSACGSDCINGHGHSGIHSCGQEHPCTALCELEGVCRPEKANKSVEHGLDLSIDIKKKIPCSIKVKCGEPGHKDHKCTRSHTCEKRCPYCQYFCDKPYKHDGIHSTLHGEMISAEFGLWQMERFEIDEHSRESSKTKEFCGVCCIQLGRGHLHLLKCNVGDTVNHPNHEKIKWKENQHHDQYNHEEFWNYVDWEDPCKNISYELRQQFLLCPVRCSHISHRESPQYCSLKTGHDPATPFGLGFFADGHHFKCTHKSEEVTPYHFILLIDQSYSMSEDPKPVGLKELRDISQTNNRLGCVFEAAYSFAQARTQMEDVYSVVLFSHVAKVISKFQKLRPVDLLNKLKTEEPTGGTEFKEGLNAAKSLIEEYKKNYENKKVEHHLSPIIILLSDGEDNGKDADVAVRDVIFSHPDAKLHTIFFGDGTEQALLQKLAKEGSGQYYSASTLSELLQKFNAISGTTDTRGLILKK